MVDEKIKNNELQNNQETKQSVIDKNKIRLIISFVIISITLFGSIMFIMLGLTEREASLVIFNEGGNIDYKVRVTKDGDFYDREWLDRTLTSYVSSEVQEIRTELNYNVASNREAQINLEYDVLGKLLITERNENNKILDIKEYQLKPITTKSGVTAESISDVINIDYKFYENIVNDLKRAGGVSISSRLLVTYRIKTYATSSIVDDVFQSGNELSISIPLGEQTTGISTPKGSINDSKQFIKLSPFKKINYIYFGIGGLFTIATLFLLVKTFFMYTGQRLKESEYEKTKKSILKEFDRIIVEADTITNGKEFDSVINVKSFNELVDVRDNLERPILFYENKKKRISTFTVVDGDLVYVYKIREE